MSEREGIVVVNSPASLWLPASSFPKPRQSNVSSES